MIYVLIGFLISCLVSQSLMDLMGTLIIIFSIVHAIKNKNKVFIKTGFEWVLLFLFLTAALGLIVNGNAETPIWSRLFEFKWIIHFYALVYIFHNFKNQIQLNEKVIKWALGIISFCSLYAIVIYFTGDPLKPAGSEFVDLALGWKNRTGGFYGYYMTFSHAYGLVFAIVYALTVDLWQKKSSLFKLSLLTSVLIGGALLLSFTRGVWLAVSVMVLVLSFIQSRRVFLMMLLSGIVAFASLYTFWGGFRERVTYVFKAQENNDSERMYLWKTNLNIWKDYPALGIGYGENTRRIDEYYLKQGAPEGQFKGHAHNQFVHLLAGMGTLGFLGYVAFLLLFLKKSFTSFKVSGRHFLPLGLFGVGLVFMVGGLTESNFEHSKLRYVWVTMMALVYYSENLKSKKEGSL